jgi:uncharacterized membrane protein YgdD (TMEM256/DUF423 family)
MNHRSTALAAGLLGVTGVGLGAFGAHGLREFLLERGMVNAWETAVRYHLLHAVALLALAVWLRGAAPVATRALAWAARGWVVGSVLFAGSLYALALGGPHGLVYVTPLGGVALLAGWVAVIVAAVREK